MRAAAALLPAAAAASAAVPATMRAVQASGEPCSAPDWACVSVATVPTPAPGKGQMLVQVRGASVNPVDVDLIEPRCTALPPPFGCSKGTLGQDFAGVVAQLGPGCSGVSVGDEVWGGARGAYAEYAVADCATASLKPKKLSFADAGTISTVGITSAECLQAAGAPWQGQKNLTVVVTSGQGGTGFIGLQLARAYGATRVVTAASGAGIPLVTKLGADLVTDFKVQNIFDALPDNSVDIVYDNFGYPGTADKAMHAIRPGGTFLVLEGGENGTISDHPKAGVKQVPFGLAHASKAVMDSLAQMFDAGTLQPATQTVYKGLGAVKDMLTAMAGGDVLGKVALDITASH